jgi:hypothetical protein
MMHLYDRETMARALASDIDPQLLNLLSTRIAALVTVDGDLTEWTEYLVIEPGDTEDEIVRHVGFSPLVEPIDGFRFESAGFIPCWDWLIDHGGMFEMTVTFGSTFAYVLLIREADGVLPDLRRMCRCYGERGRP